MTFDGKVDGEIQTDDTLHLGDSAVINGNISAQTVVVRDKINGNIVAKDKIETLGMGKTQPVPGVVCNQKNMKELIACLGEGSTTSWSTVSRSLSRWLGQTRDLPRRQLPDEGASRRLAQQARALAAGLLVDPEEISILRRPHEARSPFVRLDPIAA